MGIRTVAFLASCDKPLFWMTKMAGKNLSILAHPSPLGRFDWSGGSDIAHRPADKTGNGLFSTVDVNLWPCSHPRPHPNEARCFRFLSAKGEVGRNSRPDI